MAQQADKEIKLKLTSEFDPAGIDEANRELEKTKEQSEAIPESLDPLPDTLDKSTKATKQLNSTLGTGVGLMDKFAGTVGKIFGWLGAVNQVVELGIKLRNWVNAPAVKAAEERAAAAEAEAQALENLNKELADYKALQEQRAKQRAEQTISAQVAKDYREALANAKAISELQSREQIIAAKREDDAFKLAQARLELKYKEGKITSEEFDAETTRLKYAKERATLDRSEADAAAAIDKKKSDIKGDNDQVAGDSERMRAIDKMMGGITDMKGWDTALNLVSDDAAFRKDYLKAIEEAKKELQYLQDWHASPMSLGAGDSAQGKAKIAELQSNLDAAIAALDAHDNSEAVLRHKSKVRDISKRVTGDADTDPDKRNKAVELLLFERGELAARIEKLDGVEGSIAAATAELKSLVEGLEALKSSNQGSRSTLAQQEDIERRGQAAVYQRNQAEADAQAKAQALKDRASAAEARAKEAEAKAKESQAAYQALHAAATNPQAAAAYQKLMGSGVSNAGDLANQALKGADLTQLVGFDSPLYQLLKTLQSARGDANTRAIVEAGNTYAQDRDAYGRARRQSRAANSSSEQYDTSRQQQQQQQQQRDRQTNEQLYNGNSQATNSVTTAMQNYLTKNTQMLTQLTAKIDAAQGDIDRLDARQQNTLRNTA